MREFQGKAVGWRTEDGLVELVLDRAPCNEVGSVTLGEFEQFVSALKELEGEAHALIIRSARAEGFCAGADLRELYRESQRLDPKQRLSGVRDFLERIHGVMNALDQSPLTTIAAVQGIAFGGGFELALTCDLIIADKTARFCFPELRLGLIPGFGGIPRLQRDVGNAVVRDLLLTGRSMNAAKAQSVGLVSQVTAEGEAVRVARRTAAQVGKFDRATRIAAKHFAKPIPHEALRREIDVFCKLFVRPAVEAGLGKFVASTDPLPYLP